jgi:hypothetical protein
VDHTKRIHAATQGMVGSENDKTIVRFDAVVQKIRSGELYGDVKYTLLTASGEQYTETGPYLICDGGYHKWNMLMCPCAPPYGEWESRWTEKLVSVRKDVEGCFGILKRRFSFLEVGVRIADKDTIDNAFFTACIIHNMLLKYDGLDKLWEEDITFAEEEGLLMKLDEDVIDRSVANHTRSMARQVHAPFIRPADLFYNPQLSLAAARAHGHPAYGDKEERDVTFVARRKLLSHH